MDEDIELLYCLRCKRRIQTIPEGEYEGRYHIPTDIILGVPAYIGIPLEEKEVTRGLVCVGCALGMNHFKLHGHKRHF